LILGYDREIMKPDESPQNGIGTLQETSLHSALKVWYARPGDRFEVLIDGFYIDIVRSDLLIEIQTRNFSAIKNKLTKLLESHPVRLVHPIAVEKWIQRCDDDGLIERRKSPKRGRFEHLFVELVRIPHLINHPNFSMEILLIREEEIRQNDGRGSWRRKGWSIVDRKLLEVVDHLILEEPQDFRHLFPPGLPDPFTSLEVAKEGRMPRYLAQKASYCMRKMGAIKIVGKRGRSLLMSWSDTTRRIDDDQ
jgi:hypothetical protein